MRGERRRKVLYAWLWPALAIAAAGCCSLESAYVRQSQRDADWLLERPVAGEAGAHVGVDLDLAALEALLNQPEILCAMPAYRHRERVEIAAGEALGFEVWARVERLSLRAAARDCLQIGLGLDLGLRLELPGLLSAIWQGLEGPYRLPGSISARAGLRPELRADGSTLLRLDLDRVQVEGFDLPVERLPEKIREPAARVLSGLGSAVSAFHLSALPLVRFGPLETGLGELSAAVSELRTDAGSNRLFAGLRLNLEVPGARLGPDFDRPQRADVRVRLCAGLLESAVRALMARGRIPRRFDGDFQPDPEGEYGVSLLAIAYEQAGLRASFRLWHLSWPCFFADLQARGSVDVSDQGRFRARLSEVRLLQASRFADRIRARLWKQTRWAADLAALSEGLLNERYLGIPGLELIWRPVRYELGSAGVELEARLEGKIPALTDRPIRM
ncbi:MAG: hypothetical protein JXR96_18060 [Deltaproteobacteria bacterium]|nr:hypothetical protein [Deltaproteobacteria bacterium]